MEKLYIITRSDLDPGSRCAQAVHAALAYALEHPEAARAWH